MQFETIEPADRALSFPGDPFERTVLLLSPDMAATRSSVESINEMPVHVPKQDILRNMARAVCRFYVAVQPNDCRKRYGETPPLYIFENKIYRGFSGS